MHNLLKRKIHNLIKKGSLICISLLIMIIPQAALAVSSSVDMANIPEPETATLDEAKKGIVRIIAGKEDEDGNFKSKAVASGFIVSNDGNTVLIVTTLHSVDFGENGIVRVAIKNDTTVEAAVEAFTEKDFCILTVDNKFNDKNIVPIRVPSLDPEDDTIADGTEVTALGFPVSVGETSDFTENDVSVQNGKIIKTATENSGYIEYDAAMPEGFDGGVLVDADGYAIGLINSKASKDAPNALDITEIDTALYKEGVTYRSRDKDRMYADLYELCDNAEELYKKADKETKNEIYRTRTAALDVLQSDPYNRDSLRSALDDFNGVVEGAGLKVPKLLILVIALGAVIIFLVIRLIILVRWNKKHNAGVSPADVSRQGMPGESNIMTQPHPQMGNNRSKKRFANGSAKETGASLVVLRTGSSYMLGSGITSLGKSPDTDISIPDNNRISRNHGYIENRGGAFYLYDSRSTNGTYLNDMPVDESGIRLVSGDIIRLANEEIRFI